MGSCVICSLPFVLGPSLPYTDSSLCVGAFAIALLSQACDEEEWYTSTTPAGIAAALHGVPGYLFTAPHSGSDHAQLPVVRRRCRWRCRWVPGGNQTMPTRVHAFQERKVSWKRAGTTPRCTGRTLSSARFFVGGDDLNDGVDGAAWTGRRGRARRGACLPGRGSTARYRTFPGLCCSWSCRLGRTATSCSTVSLCRCRCSASSSV